MRALHEVILIVNASLLTAQELVHVWALGGPQLLTGLGTNRGLEATILITISTSSSPHP